MTDTKQTRNRPQSCDEMAEIAMQDGNLFIGVVMLGALVWWLLYPEWWGVSLGFILAAAILKVCILKAIWDGKQLDRVFAKEEAQYRNGHHNDGVWRPWQGKHPRLPR